MIALETIRTMNNPSQGRTSEVLRRGSERVERAGLIIDNAPDAVIEIDLEGRIIEWNIQASVLFGWTLEQVIDRPFWQTTISAQFEEAIEKSMDRCRTMRGPATSKCL